MGTLSPNTTSDLGPVPVFSLGGVQAPPQAKRWTREEYYRLAEQGWFRDQRVELIAGEIIVLSPQSHSHYSSIERVRRLLDAAFGVGYWIRPQGPVARDEHTEPEPDLCVVQGSLEDFDDHPTASVLMMEINKTSLAYDTTTKAHLYASMGVPDYWVLDLQNRQLLVYRQPVEESEAPFGFRYAQVETIAADGQVSPLEKPDAKLAIADMLPPQK